MKLEAIAQELGLSRSRIVQVLVTIYRLLNVSGQMQLALELGKEWKTVEPKLLASLEGDKHGFDGSSNQKTS